MQSTDIGGEIHLTGQENMFYDNIELPRLKHLSNCVEVRLMHPHSREKRPTAPYREKDKVGPREVPKCMIELIGALLQI